MKSIKNKIVYEENINEISGKSQAIVFPENSQELKNIIKLSEEDIVLRGNGTSFTGACIPKNSVVIDFSKMNRILKIDSVNKLAIVEPGVLLSDLNDELEYHNLEFPIQPIFSGIHTIGGMIAKNASGNREIKYSRMLSWIDSIEVINGKGEQFKVPRSDLSDFVGMEGTTGAIILATLRLTGKKERSITILKASTLTDVFIANRKLRLKQDISSIDLMNPEISSFLGLEKKYHLFVEVESLEGTFKGENYEKFIRLKNKAYKKTAAEGFTYISNIKFLIDSLQDFMVYLEEKKIPFFSHLASGVIFPLFRKEDLGKMQEAMNFAKKMKGKIAYNFGIGLTKKDSLDPGEIELIRRAKNRQDPQWKMNADKLIDLKLSEKSRKEDDFKIKETENELEKEIKENPNEYEEQKTKEENLNKINPPKKERQELTPDEREKIKKIAGGFFSGKK